MLKLDLNCDMGELPDAAHESALMELVTSANIACGGHAGDDSTMERTVRLALSRGVRIGAHPGYPDRANFGRVAMPLTADEIAATVREQVERLDRVALRNGARIEHVKPHGELYNAAMRDEGIARAIASGVGAWNREVILFGLAGSPALTWWREMGFAVAGEAFADRRYQEDGSLRPRRFPDALITDPGEAAAQARRFACEGSAQTLCVHGDTPGAVEILRACRQALL
jgi:UPF0271 protein